MVQVVEHRDPLEIYAGKTGFIVLKQPRNGYRDDACICIHPDDISQVIEHLKVEQEAAYEIRKEIAEE